MKHLDKILTREGVREICIAARAENKKVGFTSGAFDMLHVGHAEFLEQARAACDLLVVAVNSDASVRRYKGPDRPYFLEQHRAQLVAALASVDYVFLFSERRNAQNIEAIQPNYYFKAGDYQAGELTSASVVEKYGGVAKLIKIQTDVSTTKNIQSILGSSSGENSPVDDGVENAEAISLDVAPGKSRPAVFLDRDGTINLEIEYLHDAEKFELLPGAGEGMKALQNMGYRLVVVTTQAGIGLGYFSKEDFYKVNRAMFRALGPFGVTLDQILFCPHGKAENCDCRKPNTGLFERAAADLNIDLPNSIVIGDKTSDLEAGRRLGLTTIAVDTGHGCKDAEFDIVPDYQAADLADAAQWLLQRERVGS